MKTTISRLLALQTLELEASPKRTPEAETLRTQIPSVMLTRYDSFVKRGKKGVALVQKGVCRGCQIALPVGVVSNLVQGLSAEVCGNCGRYLFMADADAAAFQSGIRADTITVSKVKAPTLKKPRATRKAKTNASETNLAVVD